MKIIVPVLNRFDLLARMVESIDVEATVYVINNSGKEQDFSYDNPLVSVIWINLPSNLGVASSWNLGIKMLPFESKWIFTSADSWFEPGALKTISEANSDVITLCSDFPYWQTFTIGEKVVEKIGLFDESLHPIYFEDNDYMRRASAADVAIVYAFSGVNHDNSSTIRSDALLNERNNATFANNQVYFQNKVAEKDFSEGRWDLTRRRVNSWD